VDVTALCCICSCSCGGAEALEEAWRIHYIIGNTHGI
jgi:hypothetical protein